MKFQEFKKSIEKPYFNRMDINFLKNKEEIFDYQISYWQKNGEIKRIKRGLYVFSEREDELSPQEVAFILYEPSYISLEYALSHYGIIPETVFNITSVSTRKTRKFSTEFGVFPYRKIKPSLFFGYEVRETEYGKYLLAEPEKALLDYLYLNLGKINTEDDIEEIRINYGELGKIINKSKFKKYLKEFNIKKLNRISNIILQKC
ncbi:MAG: hypothetical protein R6V40_04830 [Candidatus Moraniibacteriota bacterium]